MAPALFLMYLPRPYNKDKPPPPPYANRITFGMWISSRPRLLTDSLFLKCGLTPSLMFAESTSWRVKRSRPLDELQVDFTCGGEGLLTGFESPLKPVEFCRSSLFPPPPCFYSKCTLRREFPPPTEPQLARTLWASFCSGKQRAGR